MFEAWLSMQAVTDKGIVSTKGEKGYCTIVSMSPDLPQAAISSLKLEWSSSTAGDAREKLSGSDIDVTNKKDKNMQLKMIDKIDSKAKSTQDSSRGSLRVQEL